MMLPKPGLPLCVRRRAKSEFFRDDDVSHDAWVQSRRQRLAAASEISIDLHTERLDTLNDQIVEIVFLQEYRSRNYQDRVRKRLLLSLVRGRWVISREEQLTYLPQQAFSAAYKE